MKTFRSDVHLVNREDVLALLEDGPKDTGKLSEWLSQPTPRVDAALKQMNKVGLVKRVGVERRWALASYVAALERPHLTRPGKALAAAEHIDEQPGLEDDVAMDTDAELVDAVLARPPLRQPHERPGSVSVKKDAPASWWVGLSRQRIRGRCHAAREGDADHAGERVRAVSDDSMSHIVEFGGV